MKWFKHPSNDPDLKRFLNHLMDKFEVKGYAWFFLLVELCAEEWDGKSEPKFYFHKRTILSHLRISARKLGELASFSESELGRHEFSLEITENHIELNLHILPKLRGKDLKYDRTKRESNDPIDIDKDINTDKEEDIDINKTETISSNHVLMLWQNTKGPHFQQQVEKPLTTETRNLIQATTRNSLQSLEAWKDYFKKVNEIGILRGEVYPDWMASFEWLIKPQNAEKVLSGKYGNSQAAQSEELSEQEIIDLIGESHG